MKKKILIVEDNNDSREIMALFITKMGYQPIKAKNSNEAIALAAGEGPDLIFMDMELPDIDGVETTAILRQNPKTATHSCRGTYGLDLGTIAGKSFASGYCHLLDQTGCTSDAKTDDRGIH